MVSHNNQKLSQSNNRTRISASSSILAFGKPSPLDIFPKKKEREKEEKPNSQFLYTSLPNPAKPHHDPIHSLEPIGPHKRITSPITTGPPATHTPTTRSSPKRPKSAKPHLTCLRYISKIHLPQMEGKMHLYLNMGIIALTRHSPLLPFWSPHSNPASQCQSPPPQRPTTSYKSRDGINLR